MFERIRQKPQHVRHALFWCLMISSTLLLVTGWFLSVRSTVGSIALKERKESAANEASANMPEFGSLKATISERWAILKDIAKQWNNE